MEKEIVVYLCEECEKTRPGTPVDGDMVCKKHGMRTFDLEPLKIYCSECARKAQRCQVCAVYVNAKEYDKRRSG